jgi:hypothetical protein
MNTYISKIKDLCIQNKYTAWYVNIISTAVSREVLPGYVEKHHILPKCFGLGGKFDKTNIAILTAKEHFVCHLLLPRMVSDKVLKSKLSYAAWQMTHINGRERYIVKSQQYESLRKQLSESYKGLPKSEQAKQRMRKKKSTTINMRKPKSVPNWNKGGTISDDHKSKCSAAMTGRLIGERNGFYGKTHSDETKQHLREINTGKKLSEKHRENISKGLQGKSTWNKGKPSTNEHRKNVSAGLTGQIMITNGVENKRIWPKDLDQYDSSVWRRGKTTAAVPKLLGQIFITNGVDNRRINPNDIFNFDLTVWRKGQT